MTNQKSKFQIIGKFYGSGETANFNPREEVWESRSMDSARYDIATMERANSLLKTAQLDDDVHSVEVIEITMGDDE